MTHQNTQYPTHYTQSVSFQQISRPNSVLDYGTSTYICHYMSTRLQHTLAWFFLTTSTVACTSSKMQLLWLSSCEHLLAYRWSHDPYSSVYTQQWKIWFQMCFRHAFHVLVGHLISLIVTQWGQGSSMGASQQLVLTADLALVLGLCLL